MKTLNSPGEALAYLTDCTLATVSSMAMLKSRKESEYRRQKSIAQTGVEACIRMQVPFMTGRILEVKDYYSGSVEEWAKKFER